MEQGASTILFKPFKVDYIETIKEMIGDEFEEPEIIISENNVYTVLRKIAEK